MVEQPYSLQAERAVLGSMMLSKDAVYEGVARLTEEDFYPIPDDRFHSCGIDDIPDGDNYLEFAKEFYELYEEDLFG